MYEAVITFVTDDGEDEGVAITRVFRVEFDSAEHFEEGLLHMREHSVDVLAATQMVIL
jgi:hypothetical protein